MVYKLVDLNGVSKIKLSEDKIKVLIPGKKNVFRAFKDSLPLFDLLAHQDEPVDTNQKEMTVYNPFTEEEFKFEVTHLSLLSTVMFENGKD